MKVLFTVASFIALAGAQPSLTFLVPTSLAIVELSAVVDAAIYPITEATNGMLMDKMVGCTMMPIAMAWLCLPRAPIPTPNRRLVLVGNLYSLSAE